MRKLRVVVDAATSLKPTFPNAQLHTQGAWPSRNGPERRRAPSVGRRDSPRYHWVRNNGPRMVYDLRSAVTHELGHAIGAQHADTS